MAHWDNLWSSGVEPGQLFDASRVEPALEDLLAEGKLGKGRALVPGCGRGYAVKALCEYGCDAVGWEISDAAATVANDYLSQHNLSPKVVTRDFFTPGEEGTFDIIYDCTFLCALTPNMRAGWADRMAALLKPKGTLITLIFPIKPGVEPADGGDFGGPPFPMSERLVRGLVEGAGLECTMMEVVKEERKARGFAGEMIATWVKP